MSTAPSPTEPSLGFAELGLSPTLLNCLEGLDHLTPTPIQTAAIPTLLGGRDLLGQAATGTGKTAAFALPLIERLEATKAGAPGGLVLAPTRELAVQVSRAIEAYGRLQGIRVATIYGGAPIGPQFGELRRGVHVVVATPGRALDHIRRGTLDLSHVQAVVLDEADEMLDMGFVEDLESILDECPDERQTVLFSATMSPRIQAIAKRYLNDPASVRLDADEATQAPSLVQQSVLYVDRRYKPAALSRILDAEAPPSALVFCRTRDEVDELSEQLAARGYRSEALHGGLSQQQRDRVMGRLREGTAELLIATDVAARGIDVDTLTHVFNYGVPASAEVYVHRIGRVGRAGRTGTAFTVAEPKQRRLVDEIERLTGQSLPEIPIPSPEQVRLRQAERTTQSVREAMSDDDLDQWQSLLHDLAGEGNDRQIALAALKLLHSDRSAAVDTSNIPAPKGRHRHRADKPGRKGANGNQPSRGRNGAPARGGRDRSPASGPDTGLIYVGVGRNAGVRPGDVVGAIANEAGLAGRQIGPVTIAPYHTVVGVPEGQVDRVIKALRSATVRGKKVKARRWTE